MMERTVDSTRDEVDFDERPIPQFTLRGNPEVEALVQRLRDLGVSECRPVCRMYEPYDVVVYASRPYLRRGQRYSAKTLDAIGIVEQRLGYLVANEVANIVAETAIRGHQLLVHVGVFPADGDDDLSIVASVIGFDVVDSADDVLTIELR